jgi:serine/threonine protein kinase
MDQKFPNPNISLQTISWNSIQLGDLLGHGGYGDVYRATWYGTSVAVKQLHLKTLAVHLQEEFNHEAQVMAQCIFRILSDFMACVQK